MEILKHGFEKRMRYKFICIHCGCEFALNQFEMIALQNNSNSTSTTSCNCPECGQTVSSYEIIEQNNDHASIGEILGSMLGLDKPVNLCGENQNIPDPCSHCTTHPINGGSGVCHCILGNRVTY